MGEEQLSLPLWLPSGAQKIGSSRSTKVLLGVLGPSGVGKSHLLRQLALDPDYAGRVAILMAEDATATYGSDADLYVVPIRTVMDLGAKVKELVDATREGKLQLKAVGVDSASGIGDYTMQYMRAHPQYTDKGKVNDYAPYAWLGTGIIEGLIWLRDHVGCDVIVMATTTRPPKVELCIDGQMTPKNFTRLTSVCLFMTSEESRYTVGETTVLPAAHRTIGVNEKGRPDGSFLDRFFTTQDTGEVPAKGHRNLALRERAILPDVLRKIHGHPVDTHITTVREGEPTRGGSE